MNGALFVPGDPAVKADCGRCRKAFASALHSVGGLAKDWP